MQAPQPFERPEAPKAAVLTPCPDGWHERAPLEQGGVITCTPWEGGEPDDCEDGQAHFVGASGCEPVGAACSSGPFSDALPPDRPVIYVQKGASGGDGSRESPYGSLAEVNFDWLESGTVVALAEGTYETDGIVLSRKVTLWGACAAKTELRAPGVPEGRGVVAMWAQGAKVRDLTIARSPTPAILVARGPVALEGVVIEEVTGVGIGLSEGELQADRVVIREVRPRSNGTLGRGLALEPGAKVTARRMVVERNQDVGVFAHQSGTELVLEDSVIRDTRPDAIVGLAGQGLAVVREATAEVRRSVIVDNHDVGIMFSSAAEGLLEDVVVRGTRSLQGGTQQGELGHGLSVQRGAKVVVRRALFERNREAGIGTFDPTTELELEDVIVRDTQPRAKDQRFGYGVGAQLGAKVDMTRTRIASNHVAGVAVLGGSSGGEPPTVNVRDVSVSGTRSSAADGSFGRGAVVQFGGVLRGSRLQLEDNRDVGMFVGAGGAKASLRDVRVLHTRPRECGQQCDGGFASGMGVGSYDGALVELTRFRIVDAALCGIQLAREGVADLSEGFVEGSPVGMCLQTSGYDVETRSRAVRYQDNGRNLSARELPVPQAVPPL